LPALGFDWGRGEERGRRDGHVKSEIEKLEAERHARLPAFCFYCESDNDLGFASLGVEASAGFAE
jgi:hypothetical protein